MALERNPEILNAVEMELSYKAHRNTKKKQKKKKEKKHKNPNKKPARRTNILAQSTL